MSDFIVTILNSIKKLPELQRQVVRDYGLQKMPAKEVAEKLNIPVGDVESIMAVATENIKRMGKA